MASPPAKILIVDDEPADLRLLADILRDHYEVIAARDGETALRRAAAPSPPDLVLLDVLLPGIDGYETCRRLKAAEATRDIPVIFLTSLDAEADETQALAMGAVDYVAKPFTVSILLARIRTHLSLRRASRDLELRNRELALAIQEKDSLRLNLEAVFRSISEAIVTVDREMRVVNANRAVDRLDWGRGGQGLDFVEAFPDAPAQCLKILRSVVETRQPVREVAVRSVAGAGDVKSLSVGCWPLFTESWENTGAVLVARDISRIVELEARLEDRHFFAKMVGRSERMQRVFSIIDQVANLDSTVLVTGESGTGKELVADALHHLSHRTGRPFIKVNCSALSESLLGSELFGHVKGAFTGAVKTRAGRFRAAEGGTILLDEIGDVPPGMQAKLLRVLESKEYEMIGDSRTLRADVRIIAATNADLVEKIRLGEFRSDLYYRLKVVSIALPSLRERPEDIPLLVEHFLRYFEEHFRKPGLQVTGEAMDLLLRHPWPGNVRQLRHVLEQAVILCRAGTIRPEDLSADLHSQPRSEPPIPGRPAQMPRGHDAVLAALERTRWNKTRAARELGISRATFYRRLSELGID